MNRAQRIVKDGHEGIEPVEFYRQGDEWGRFSNFSNHPVHLPHPFTHRIVIYKTGEHRFQAMKATTADDHDYVVAGVTPFEAKERGGPRGIILRDGWGDSYGDLCWYVMAELVLAKAIQHPVVFNDLERTEGRPIWEDSPVDDIWGIRYREAYTGKNLLGAAWGQTRSILGIG